ncbi:MATE family efflux transporter [Paenibacillus marinisediminis]
MLNNKERNMSLWVLVWPIFIELFLQFLLGTVDTLMVSRISDDAVAVVGFSNQLFNALTTLFATISAGAGILVAQKLGARRQEDARTIGIMAFTVTAAIGLFISLTLITMPETIAGWLQMPENLMPMAVVYIQTVGGSMILTAMMSALSTVIRNTGNTKGPMLTAIGMNVIHVILNYGFIFGEFGMPQLGLNGVAYSTVISRLLAVMLLLFMFIHTFERRIQLKELLSTFDLPLFKEILRIGWPLGVSNGNWVFSQLVIFTFIAMLGPKELAARTYMSTLESFCALLGMSVAMGSQIKIAYLFGAKKYKEAYRSAYRGLYIGLGVVFVNALIIYVLGDKMLGLFTTDTEIIAIGVSLLALNVLLQPGKMLNMGLNSGLNAVGDTKFVMIISLVSMWGIATGMSYLLSIEWGLGLIGIYICMISDEYLRGLLCLWRWRGQKYLRKAQGLPAREPRRGNKGSVTLDSPNA